MTGKLLWGLRPPNDDITRGIGQLAEALAYGYDRATLVTTLGTLAESRPESSGN